MEQWHHLYELPYDEARPLIYCDERPCQLIGNTLQPIAMKPGKEMRENYEYQCHGTCSLFFAIEPLTGRRFLEIRERRKKIAHFIKKLARSHRKALQIVVGQDNLNTHTPASFHQTLEPKKVLEMAQCFEMQFTPKKASWLKLNSPRPENNVSTEELRI